MEHTSAAKRFYEKHKEEILERNRKYNHDHIEESMLIRKNTAT